MEKISTTGLSKTRNFLKLFKNGTLDIEYRFKQILRNHVCIKWYVILMKSYENIFFDITMLKGTVNSLVDTEQ